MDFVRHFRRKEDFYGIRYGSIMLFDIKFVFVQANKVSHLWRHF